MRKATLLILLERERARPHQPRSIAQLSPQQETDAPLMSGLGSSELSGPAQRHDGLTGRIRVALQRRRLSPTAVLPLFGQKRPSRLIEMLRICLRPIQSKQAHGV